MVAMGLCFLLPNGFEQFLLVCDYFWIHFVQNYVFIYNLWVYFTIVLPSPRHYLMSNFAYIAFHVLQVIPDVRTGASFKAFRTYGVQGMRFEELLVDGHKFETVGRSEA
jgi:hypothetical protein